ncbi:MAG TPA: alpha/beta hydrolase, partial [Myxococcales bacterium]|nr:alpha/beta hydrolase [Myxococcales bacterium]
YAYVGMGQVIDGQANEREGYALTLQAAKAAGNAKAVSELLSIAPYPAKDGSLPLEKIGLERGWSIKLGGLAHGRDSFDFYEHLELLSPEYSEADQKAIDKGSQLSLKPLLPELGKFDYSKVTHFDCPIILFEGRFDATTPSHNVADWLQRVQAPKTQLVWFENSAHMMMIEEPGRMLVHLVQDVLPLAN